MMCSHKKITKFVTTLVANTEVQLPYRIIICYSSSARKNRPRILRRLYVRVGNSVLSISPSRDVPLLTMLRLTLIALLSCRQYISTASKLDRSFYVANFRLSVLCRFLKTRYGGYSTSALLDLTCRTLNDKPLTMFLCGRRLSIVSTQDLAYLTSSLIMTELDCIPVISTLSTGVSLKTQGISLIS